MRNFLQVWLILKNLSRILISKVKFLNITRWKILLLFITVLWGGHRTIKGVYFTKGKKIFIETDITIPIHADGEYKGDESVSVQVKEKAVSLLNGIETRHL